MGRGASMSGGREDDELSNRELRQIIRSLAIGRSMVPPPAASRSDQTRKVQGLAHHNDGLDVAKYIRKLEADLTDIGVLTREFKTILYQKLSSKTASQIVASIDRDECSYEELCLCVYCQRTIVHCVRVVCKTVCIRRVVIVCMCAFWRARIRGSGFSLVEKLANQSTHIASWLSYLRLCLR